MAKRPDPELRGGRWEVSLRSHGFGQHYPLGPGTLSREEAIHLGYGKLEELRAARLAEPHAQLEIAAGGPPTFAGALDRWQRQKRYDNPDSKSYGDEYAGWVRDELGSYRLDQFTDAESDARLAAYVDSLVARGFAAKTVRNRISVVFQVLRFCAAAARRWVAFVPTAPTLPPLPDPRFDWIDERIFRLLRDDLYRATLAQVAGSLLKRKLKIRPELWIEGRRCYLSLMMYTGARTRDADQATADDIGMDTGTYIANSSKTGADPEQFPMPEQLQIDLRRYLDVAGREFFLPGERFGMGRWPKVARELADCARRLGIEVPCNPRVLRRSFAREMFKRGYSEKRVADMLRHADLRMLHQVYLRAPKPEGRELSLWTVQSSRTTPRGGGVVQFPGGAGRAKVE